MPLISGILARRSQNASVPFDYDYRSQFTSGTTMPNGAPSPAAQLGGPSVDFRRGMDTPGRGTVAFQDAANAYNLAGNEYNRELEAKRVALATLQAAQQGEEIFAKNTIHAGMTQEQLAAAQQQRVNSIEGGAEVYRSLVPGQTFQIGPDGTINKPRAFDVPAPQTLAGKTMDDRLNTRLYNDPKFQYVLQKDPQRAAKIYEAMTGSSLSNDSSAYVALLKGREDAKIARIKSLAGQDLFFDEKTGKVKKRVLTKDAMGNVVTDQQIDLDPNDTQLIESGDYSKHTGYSGYNQMIDKHRLSLAQELAKRDAIARMMEARAEEARLSQVEQDARGVWATQNPNNAQRRGMGGYVRGGNMLNYPNVPVVGGPTGRLTAPAMGQQTMPTFQVPFTMQDLAENYGTGTLR